MKKLKRSSTNKVIAGVFGGLGENMDIDPTILRLVGLLLFLIVGFVPFVIVYIVAVLIIPKTEEEIKRDAQTSIYRKWWFWIIISLIILFLVSLLTFFIFRKIGSIPNVNIHTEESVSKSSGTAQEIFKEEKEEVVEYLQEEILKPNYDGEIFADYHRFGRSSDELYVWAYISEYYLKDNELNQGNAASLPLALKFKDGKVTTYIKPRDGADYGEDVRKIFPSRIEDKVLTIQEQTVLSSENEYKDLITHLEKSVKEQGRKEFNLEE